MRLHHALFAIVLVAVAFAAGRATLAEEPEPKAVVAQRYTVEVHESALGFVHGDGTTIIELYFPADGIVCNVQGHHLAGVVMNAFHGECRHGLFGEAAKVLETTEALPPPEEIEVPAKLYARIKALAELTRERRTTETELRRDLVASGLFGETR